MSDQCWLTKAHLKRIEPFSRGPALDADEDRQARGGRAPDRLGLAGPDRLNRHASAKSPHALEQLVSDRIVGAGGKPAFQQRRDHVERGEADHQPYAGARERADSNRLRVVLELAVEQQHGGDQGDGHRKPMKAQV